MDKCNTFMRYILILFLFTLTSCSDNNYQSRELPTKYPDSATMGSADDVTQELYKK